MEMIDVNSVQLACEQTGEGPPVVLVHGSWTDRRAWDLVAPSLVDHYRVITYDRRGHSQSQRLPGVRGIDTQVADLAARLFVETIALGPGGWELLPEQVHQTMAFNAPTFLDVECDPTQGVVDPSLLAGVTAPVLLTAGGQSPPEFAAILDRLAAALNVGRHTFADAGHVPHRTHPQELADVVLGFLDDVTRTPEVAAPGRS